MGAWLSVKVGVVISGALPSFEGGKWVRPCVIRNQMPI